ncbi:MAG: hypothetical protein OXU51_16780 [Candidatus Poribacteria bacterium]|nr:hypothetical protein [Candidatus Poribacteria bacterium]
MLKDFFSNRLFLGALAFFILCVGGSLLYMRHVERQEAEKLAETEARVKQWNEKHKEQSPAKASVVEPSAALRQFHADGTFHAEQQMPITHKSEASEEELEFWKKLGVAPPPQGYSYAELADGTMRLQKDNVPIVKVHIGTTPEFNVGWLPDDAYYYYDALIALSSGHNLRGVGHPTPAETARAREMKDAFKKEWAPHTNIGFSASGVWDTDDHDIINEISDKAIVEKERELQASLGISENRNRPFDVDLMSEILTQIREELSQ